MIDMMRCKIWEIVNSCQKKYRYIYIYEKLWKWGPGTSLRTSLMWPPHYPVSLLGRLMKTIGFSLCTLLWLYAPHKMTNKLQPETHTKSHTLWSSLFCIVLIIFYTDYKSTTAALEFGKNIGITRQLFSLYFALCHSF